MKPKIKNSILALIGVLLIILSYLLLDYHNENTESESYKILTNCVLENDLDYKDLGKETLIREGISMIQSIGIIMIMMSILLFFVKRKRKNKNEI